MKTNSSRKNVGKYIALGIAVLLIIIVSVAVYLYNFYIKPDILEPIQQISENIPDDNSSFSSDILLEELENVLSEEDVQEYINQVNPSATSELITVIEDAKERNRQKKTEHAENTQSPAEADIPENTAQPQKIQTPTPKSEPTPTAKQNKYDKYKEQVDPKDLKDAISLAGKVDAGYILGLVSGGLNSENKTELKKYLMSRLSSSEISRGIQLFAKYSYLL